MLSPPRSLRTKGVWQGFAIYSGVACGRLLPPWTVHPMDTPRHTPKLLTWSQGGDDDVLVDGSDPVLPEPFLLVADGLPLQVLRRHFVVEVQVVRLCWWISRSGGHIHKRTA
jgi:hypothetical protein